MFEKCIEFNEKNKDSEIETKHKDWFENSVGWWGKGEVGPYGDLHGRGIRIYDDG